MLREKSLNPRAMTGRIILNKTLGAGLVPLIYSPSFGFLFDTQKQKYGIIYEWTKNKFVHIVSTKAQTKTRLKRIK